MRRTGFLISTGAVYLLACAGASAGQAEPTPTRVGSGEPLTMPSVGVPADWLTKAERTDFRETPSYNETIASCRRLASASEWIRYESFGVSPEGREMPLLIASTRGILDSAGARTGKTPVVLVQNCIHAGECAGKDASLMLLRDIAVTKTRRRLLDHAVLLVIPIFNVDGHERFSPYSRINQNGPKQMGWRVTSRNLNLNRDYMKADTVEMRAWLALWNKWRPDVLIDNHTTDGGDWQYDLLLAVDTHQAASPPIAKWLEDTLCPRLLPALAKDGHTTMTYFTLIDRTDPSKGLRSGGFAPRYSNGYGSIRNRPSILVETHMLKPYRRRVITCYNAMRRVLEVVSADPDSLRAAVEEADAATARIGAEYDPGYEMPIVLGETDESVPLTFKGFNYRRELSAISGNMRIIYDDTAPIDIETEWFNGTRVEATVAPPLAYIIPPQWTEVIERVRAHGLRAERLAEPLTMEVESYRLSDPTFATKPFEGRFRVSFEIEPIVEARTLRPGSVIVPLDQPDAKVAVHLFEPEAPDSLVSWGFFNAIFEQKEYAEPFILEKLAREMLAAEPSLRDEFETILKSSKEFAGSIWPRLYFFYERSPYWDPTIGVYPIARVTRPIGARTEPF